MSLFPTKSICFGHVLVLLLATHATADDPAKNGKVKDGWKSLFDGKTLDGWKAAKFSGEGKVQVKDGVIVMEKGSSMTGVTYARDDFPKVNYEVAFEGKRLDGNDFFCTATFPVGDAYCSFVVGGWGGQTVGLSSINSQDASANETSTSKEFKLDQWYRFTIRVTKEKIMAWIDDDKMVDLETKERRISIRIECRPSRPFGFSTWHTSGAVRNIRIKALSEAEQKESAASKPTDK